MLLLKNSVKKSKPQPLKNIAEAKGHGLDLLNCLILPNPVDTQVYISFYLSSRLVYLTKVIKFRIITLSLTFALHVPGFIASLKNGLGLICLKHLSVFSSDISWPK